MSQNLHFLKRIKGLKSLKWTDNVVYVGPELSDVQKAQLSDTGNPIVFVQDIIASLSQDVLDYNFPGVALPDGFSVEGIQDMIRAELGFETDPSCYMAIYHDEGQFCVYDALSVDELVEHLQQVADKPWEMSKRVFPYNAPLDFESDLENRTSTVYHCMIEPEVSFSGSLMGFQTTPRDRFTDEMNQAAAEVEQKLKHLLLKGFPAEIVKSWLTDSIKLSRLRITRNFKIYLVDYDKEVKMGPLPKTIFLFYLRHPEGVMFPYLQDHVDELLDIYSCVSVNDDPQKMRESIEYLIDPFNNSIYEKCAAVKKAFISQIADDVARNYYIKGSQGDKRLITLDRNLVEWECDLP